MKKLTFEQARKEITEYNNLVKQGIISKDNSQSIDRALEYAKK